MKRFPEFPNPRRLGASLLLVACLAIAPRASAVNMTLSSEGVAPITGGVGMLLSDVGETITFVVGLEESRGLNGYELFLSFDESELSFVSASNDFVPGLPFTVAPEPGENPSIRVATLFPSSAPFPSASLFRVTFEVIGTLRDDLADFQVFASGSDPLSPGDVALDNPSGVGFDVFSEVPEPSVVALMAVGLAGLAAGSRRRA